MSRFSFILDSTHVSLPYIKIGWTMVLFNCISILWDDIFDNNNLLQAPRQLLAFDNFVWIS